MTRLTPLTAHLHGTNVYALTNADAGMPLATASLSLGYACIDVRDHVMVCAADPGASAQQGDLTVQIRGHVHRLTRPADALLKVADFAPVPAPHALTHSLHTFRVTHSFTFRADATDAQRQAARERAAQGGPLLWWATLHCTGETFSVTAERTFSVLSPNPAQAHALLCIDHHRRQLGGPRSGTLLAPELERLLDLGLTPAGECHITPALSIPPGHRSPPPAGAPPDQGRTRHIDRRPGPRATPRRSSCLPPLFLTSSDQGHPPRQSGGLMPIHSQRAAAPDTFRVAPRWPRGTL